MRMRIYMVALAVLCVACSCNRVPEPDAASIPSFPSYVEAAPRTLCSYGFEQDEKHESRIQQRISSSGALKGEKCLAADLEDPGKYLAIPLSIPRASNARVSLGFWARASGTVEATARLRFSDGQQRDIALGYLSPEWSFQDRGIHVGDAGIIEIVLRFQNRDEHNAATLWLDDVAVKAHRFPPATAEWLEMDPAMDSEPHGVLWLATVARSGPRAEIRLRTISETGTQLVWRYPAEPGAGLERPALDVSPSGCLLAFAAEREGKWRVHYALFPDDSTDPAAIPLHSPDGWEGILPNVAWAGGTACLVWESRQGPHRVVRSAWLSPDRPSQPTVLSSREHSSRSPSVCVLSDGRAFAVWDSCRTDSYPPSWDLYGAWYEGGKWQNEVHITRDPRIERHAHAFAHHDTVWLAWEACAFKEHKVHWLEDERIVIARYINGTLEMPLGLNESPLATAGSVRSPRILVDGHNTLWVSFRRWSDGWEPVLARYSGSQWHGARVLKHSAAFSIPVPLALSNAGCVAALSHEDLAYARTSTRLDVPRFAGICVVQGTESASSPASAPETTTLDLPHTDFTLSERLRRNAPLPARPVKRADERSFTLFFGDLHEHSDISICLRKVSPRLDDLYVVQKDLEGLDFTAVTDHGFDFDPLRWKSAAERARTHHDPNAFVTFLGQEWTKDTGLPATGLGHRTIIHRDLSFPDFFVATAESSVESLWSRLDPETSIVIPHQLADTMNCPVGWAHHNPRLEPLAEIWQHRGSYECLGCPRQAEHSLQQTGHFLQDAWARGIMTGVAASPDHGGGYGKTGVWAEALTRAAIFESLRARRTFATTDGRFSLFVTANGHVLGEIVEGGLPETVTIRIEALTVGRITEAVILRNNQPVLTAQGNGPELALDWQDPEPPRSLPVWYYARVTRDDGEMAWSSPIWFTAGLQAIAANGP